MPSGFYLTTSRKPSVLTRKLVRWLEVLVGGESENRGKRSVRELAERAAQKGFGNLLVIHEDHGNPSQLCFLEGIRMLACVNLGHVQLPEPGLKPGGLNRAHRKLSRQGKVGGKVADLIAAGMSEGDPGSSKVLEVNCSDACLDFRLNGKALGPKIAMRSIKEFEGQAEEGE